MELEDYFKRQIDQLGRVLGIILAGLTGLGSQGQSTDGIETAKKELKAQAGISLDDLSSIPVEKLISLLQEDKKWNAENSEMLAYVCFLLAGEAGIGDTASDGKNELYLKSLALYNHADSRSLTYSFERQDMIRQIKTVLAP